MTIVLSEDDVIVENMTDEYGSGWWDSMPWRARTVDCTVIGEGWATKREAEVDALRIRYVVANRI